MPPCWIFNRKKPPEKAAFFIELLQGQNQSLPVVGAAHSQAQMAVEFAAQRKQATASETVWRREARQKPQVSP